MASLTDEKDKQVNTGIIDAYQSLYMSGLPNDGNVVVTGITIRANIHVNLVIQSLKRLKYHNKTQ
ncbi:hypothetical protein ACU42Y_20045 [Proteus mirabilis]